MAETGFLQGFLSEKGVFWRGGTAKLYLLELDRTVILFNAALQPQRIAVGCKGLVCPVASIKQEKLGT